MTLKKINWLNTSMSLKINLVMQFLLPNLSSSRNATPLAMTEVSKSDPIFKKLVIQLMYASRRMTNPHTSRGSIWKTTPILKRLLLKMVNNKILI